MKLNPIYKYLLVYPVAKGMSMVVLGGSDGVAIYEIGKKAFYFRKRSFRLCISHSLLHLGHFHILHNHNLREGYAKYVYIDCRR